MENATIIKLARVVVKVLSILTVLLAGITALTGVLAVIYKEPVLEFLMKFVDKRVVSANGLSFMSMEEVIIKTVLLLVYLIVLYVIFRLVGRLLDNLLADKIFIGKNVELVKHIAYATTLYSLLPTTSRTGVTLNINLSMLLMAFIIWIFSQVFAKAVAEQNKWTT